MKVGGAVVVEVVVVVVVPGASVVGPAGGAKVFPVKFDVTFNRILSSKTRYQPWQLGTLYDQSQAPSVGLKSRPGGHC